MKGSNTFANDITWPEGEELPKWVLLLRVFITTITGIIPLQAYIAISGLLSLLLD